MILYVQYIGKGDGGVFRAVPTMSGSDVAGTALAGTALLCRFVLIEPRLLRYRLGSLGSGASPISIPHSVVAQTVPVVVLRAGDSYTSNETGLVST